MTLDDESALSAYLDGELSPEETRVVDRASASDPAIAARLVALATTSEAVAGLSRCAAPCGLASTVLARISADPPRRRAPFWLATAASVAFAFLLAAKSGLLPTSRPGVDPELHLVVVDRPKAPARDVVAIDEPLLDPIEIGEPPIAVDPLGPVADPADSARRTVVDLLDRPGLRRVLVPLKAADATAADRVGDILRNTARKDPVYGRISVPGGLAIDPTFPDEAEVFTAMMDGPEYEQFLDRLNQVFGEVVLDTRFDPAIAMQLADFGRVSVGSGHTAAGLVEPPVDPALAEKAGLDPHPPIIVDEPADPNSPDPIERVRSQYERDHPTTGRIEAPGDPSPTPKGARARSKPATGPVPVLIWVTTKARD